jgi:osmotically-inducible protein OsmY
VLTGNVRDQAQSDRAVATARNIDGVVEVENRLLVGKG